MLASSYQRRHETPIGPDGRFAFRGGIETGRCAFAVKCGTLPGGGPIPAHFAETHTARLAGDVQRRVALDVSLK